MRPVIVLALILIYTAISRFWHLDTTPPHLVTSEHTLRYMGVFAALMTTWLVHFYTRILRKNIKISLLAAWAFAVIPWAVEQGRVVSLPTLFLPIFLLLVIGVRTIQKKRARVAWSVITLAIIGVYYWQLWLWQTDSGFAPATKAFRHFFQVLSPEMLFVSNSTFWWGGIREFGMMFLSMTPFFLLGLIQLARARILSPLLWVLSIACIASFSPAFPEGRQAYLTIPFFCLFVANGMYLVCTQLSRWNRILSVGVCTVLIFEMIQFWHYYHIHYPMQVREHMKEIVQPY